MSTLRSYLGSNHLSLEHGQQQESCGLAPPAAASRYSKPKLINLSRCRGNDNLNGLIPKKLQQLWPFSIHGWSDLSNHGCNRWFVVNGKMSEANNLRIEV